MANGTITSIIENGTHINVSVSIGGSIYTALVSKAVFDALPTALEKQNFIINILSLSRRTDRQYENIYTSFIGNVLVIPD